MITDFYLFICFMMINNDKQRYAHLLYMKPTIVHTEENLNGYVSVSHSTCVVF